MTQKFMNTEIKPKESNKEENFIDVGSDVDEPIVKVIEVTNKQGDKVKKDLNLSQEGNKARIIVTLWDKKRKPHFDSNSFQPYFKKEAWESKEKWEKAEKEALLNFLTEKGLSKFHGKVEETDLDFELVNNGGKINLRINIPNGHRDIKKSNLEVQLEFFSYHKIGLQTWSSQSQSEGRKIPSNWIIFFIVLIVLAVPFFIFRKKIWKWLKGEKNKKKTEQLDIF